MRVLRLLGAVVIVTGCGGGGDGGGTPPPGTVASVTITPNSAQSTSLCGEVSFSAQPRDAQSNTLSRTVTWTSTATGNVVVSPTTGPATTATGVGVGASTIRATADGVPSPDVTVTVGAGGQAPASAGVTAGSTTNTFSPGCVVVAAGGTVTWTFGALAHNVIFDAPRPAAADIDPAKTNTTEQRTFPAAGKFSYQCTLHGGMNGRVIVQ